MSATVDIVIPVYNEEKALAPQHPDLDRLSQEANLSNPWQIIIADNASSD